MKVKEIVEEVVRNAIKRNEGREQYFAVVYRSPVWDGNDLYVGEDRVDQVGLTAAEGGFGGGLRVPGKLLIAIPNACHWIYRRAGRFWNGAKDEYAPAVLDQCRFVWNEGYWEFFEGVDDEYPYGGLNYESDANEEEEKKIRETLEELFKINEQYDGWEVERDFHPYKPYPGDSRGIARYLFETSDPEYLRGELNQFRVNAVALSCKFDLYIASDEGGKEESVCIDSETSGDTIRDICERFRSCDCVRVNCEGVEELADNSVLEF